MVTIRLSAAITVAKPIKRSSECNIVPQAEHDATLTPQIWKL